jgi:hypothetical protein
VSSVRLDPAVAADAAAVTMVVVALESSLYGQTAFSQADLEDEWSDIDLEQNARVVRDGCSRELSSRGATVVATSTSRSIRLTPRCSTTATRTPGCGRSRPRSTRAA